MGVSEYIHIKAIHKALKIQQFPNFIGFFIKSCQLPREISQMAY
jgi:hypothetical protein